ncbi:HD domain-containing protein [Methanoregula sp.]|uniref:HD domain-containing protein n=1 Tax=Methanoregula sp. TaxID=2052170 RepID=UPI003C72478A
MEGTFETIRNHVAAELGQAGSHGMDHVERVTRLCRQIGAEEHADMAILIPAALLHDIARPAEEAQGTPHEEEGARIAEMYLRSIHYDETRIPAITGAIRTHRFRSKELPATLEAKILSDADKLDAMGASGIARTFIRAGEHGGGIDDAVAHVHDKLLKLRGMMYTESGRRIAGTRHAFLTSFLDTLEEERQGSRKG